MNYKPAVFRLSHSSRTIGCARKFEFRKLYPQTPRTVGLPAEVGKALHAGYQDYLVHEDRDRAIAAMMLAYPIQLCENPSDYRSLEACYATLNCMFDSNALGEYEIATILCLDGNERPAIEVPFRILLKDIYLDAEKTIPIVYVGYIDAILFHRMTTEYVAPDIKTHRNNLFDLSPLYSNSEQCLPYSLVIEHMLQREVKNFDIKYISVYVDMLEPKAQVYTFPKTHTHVQDWLLGLALDVQRYQQYYALDFWPRNGENCLAYKSKCWHYDYCDSRDKDVVSTMILKGGDTEPEKPFTPWIEFELELGG